MITAYQIGQSIRLQLFFVWRDSMATEKELVQELQSDLNSDLQRIDRAPHSDFMEVYKKAYTSFLIDVYRTAIIAFYCATWLILHEQIEKKGIAVMILGVELVTGWIVDIQSQSPNCKIDGKTLKNRFTFMTIFALICFVDGQSGWHSFLSFLLLAIILISEVNMEAEFPNESMVLQIIWMIPVGIQFIRWLFFSSSLDQDHLTFFEFVFLNEFLGLLPAIIRLVGDSYPFSKAEFFYSQMHHSQMIRFCLLPFYQSISFTFILFMLGQNCLYLLLMKKMKPEIVAAKMGRQKVRNNIFRLGQNTFTIVTSAEIKKKYISFFYPQKLKFNEELCCMCSKNPISFMSEGCEHVTLCLKCLTEMRGDLCCCICKRIARLGIYSVASNLPQMTFLKSQGIDSKKYCLNHEYWATKRNSIAELQEEQQ